MTRLSLILLLSFVVLSSTLKTQEFGQTQTISNSLFHLIDQTVNELLSIRQLQFKWNFNTKGNYYSLFETKYKNNQMNLIKLQGIIPTSFDSANKYYFEVFDKNQRNTMCGDMSLIERIDENNLVSFYKSEGNIFVSSREHLALQNRQYLGKDEVLITKTTIGEYPNVPVDQSAIRMNGKVYGIFLKKLSEKETQVELYSLFEIGGNVPYFLANMMSDKLLEVHEADINFIIRI